MDISLNIPDFWLSALPCPAAEGHKYDRGMALIAGASPMTGATRLAAAACARVGAGVTRVAVPVKAKEMAAVYRASLPAHIIVDDTTQALDDPRCRAFLAGPGDGGADATLIRRAWATGHLNGIVLDAGAFLLWGTKKAKDFAAQAGPKTVVTPHQGEFERFFSGSAYSAVLIHADRAGQACAAAQALGCVMVLKGPQTIVADGQRCVVNEKSTPYLATAGAGDVLAGIIAGLIAQGMPPFEASCAAVWMHSRAAEQIGPGLVASDLPDLLPHVLGGLLNP